MSPTATTSAGLSLPGTRALRGWGSGVWRSFRWDSSFPTSILAHHLLGIRSDFTSALKAFFKMSRLTLKKKKDTHTLKFACHFPPKSFIWLDHGCEQIPLFFITLHRCEGGNGWAGPAVLQAPNLSREPPLAQSGVCSLLPNSHVVPCASMYLDSFLRHRITGGCALQAVESGGFFMNGDD